MTRRSGLDIITAIIGCLLIGSGLYGLLAPVKMARVFGLVNPTRDMAVMFPGIGGRNLGAGLAVWGMKLAGQRKALGIFLCCWVCGGLGDTYLLLTLWDSVDAVWLHVFLTGVLAVVGPALLLNA